MVKKIKARKARTTHALRKKPAVLAYHQLTFQRMFRELSNDIVKAVSFPEPFRRQFWQPLAETTCTPQESWNLLSRYLDVIEGQIRNIIERHSYFYWLHLYRRIGIGIDGQLGNKTDPNTIGLVRETLETAIVRYGALLRGEDDICLSSQMRAGEVLGGEWRKDLLRALPDEAAVEQAFHNISDPPQFMLRQFGPNDLVDIANLEALAYEYWLTTARMRAAGKGGWIVVDSAGRPTSHRPDSLELLIQNYDGRIKHEDFSATLTAVSFPDVSAKQSQLAVAVYNVDKQPLSVAGIRELQGGPANFIGATLDIISFYQAHSFIEEPFREQRGYGLGVMCAVLASGINIATGYLTQAAGRVELAMLQFLQRAYATIPNDSFESLLQEGCAAMLSSWFGTKYRWSQGETHLALEALTLVPAKQGGAGLWSRGPRYVFSIQRDLRLVDFAAVIPFLQSAFVGVRYDSARSPKGVLFEDFARERLAGAGFEVLPLRTLETPEGNRETDVAVRVRETLYLCECRAMERPLDYERGKPSTLAVRNADLGDKVSQVLSLRDTLIRSPVGKNYDLRWARSIIGVVLSPFVEWIWAPSADLWIDHQTPRILTVDEAIAFLRRQ